MIWTQKRMDELRGLWHTELSASQIGKRMGISKGAVISKVHRMGLKSRKIAVVAAKKVRGQTTGHRHAPLPKMWRGVYEAVMALQHNSCRYPIGEPDQAGFRFCMHVTIKGGVYCTEHKNLCWEKAKPLATGKRQK
jgi:GcrA cell cycle regulator